MTHTVVTGAAGYVGTALVATLAHTVPPGSMLIATDRRLAESAAALRLRPVEGDITDDAVLDALFAEPVTTLFHLAGVVSGAAEADFDTGRRINLVATMALLERCRRQAESGGPVVRFIYASSIAVFGTPLPRRIDDATAPAPTLSYGTHKRVVELLIDDATRRGELDGRALRLPGIVVRPALPNGALSGFNSDLIREPLAGNRYVCPVAAEATIWIASLHDAIANLLRLSGVDGHAIGPQRAITMPALAVRVADIVAAIARVEPAAAARIEHRPLPAIEAQFGCWPLDCTFAKGQALGLVADASIDDVIRRHSEPA